jgi:hypothetical protein
MRLYERICKEVVVYSSYSACRAKATECQFTHRGFGLGAPVSMVVQVIEVRSSVK